MTLDFRACFTACYYKITSFHFYRKNIYSFVFSTAEFVGNIAFTESIILAGSLHSMNQIFLRYFDISAMRTLYIIKKQGSVLWSDGITRYLNVSPTKISTCIWLEKTQYVSFQWLEQIRHAYVDPTPDYKSNKHLILT